MISPKGKKILIWSGVGIGVIIVFVMVKKALSATATAIIPMRTNTAGSASVSNNIFVNAKNWLVSEANSTGLTNGLLHLPAGFKISTNGQITTSDGTIVKTYDPNSGAYQETDGTWYLESGVALTSYDSNTGSYQEEDGTWYAFDGTPLSYYNTSNGQYVEESDPTTLYNSDGSIANNNYTV